MTLPVTEAVTYKGRWSEVLEAFWMKRKINPAIGIAWKKLQRWTWRQSWGSAVLYAETPEITLTIKHRYKKQSSRLTQPMKNTKREFVSPRKETHCFAKSAFTTWANRLTEVSPCSPANNTWANNQHWEQPRAREKTEEKMRMRHTTRHIIL